MGLYQYKDFLTLDDVGYFLLSKGLLPPVPIEQLYLSDLRPFIISMIQSDKITPVFDYDGYVIIIDRNIYEYEVDTYKGMVQASHTMIQNWKKGKAIFYKPFKGQFDPFQDTFVNERYRKYIDRDKRRYTYTGEAGGNGRCIIQAPIGAGRARRSERCCTGDSCNASRTKSGRGY